MADTLQYTIGLEVQKALAAMRDFRNAMAQVVPVVNQLKSAIAGVERSAGGSGGGPGGS